MRGLVLHLLQRTCLGTHGAILVTAVGWGVLHYSYGAGTVALIVIDGALFGLARVYGRSLWLPVGMHALGNVVSIYQSLS